MAKHLTTFCLLLSAVGFLQFGCSNESDDVGTKSVERSGQREDNGTDDAETSPVDRIDQTKGESGPELRIDGPREQQRDLLKVTLSVRNNTNSPLGWDKEFSVFVTWTLLSEGGEHLEQVHVSDIERTEEGTDKARFVSLQPGERMKKNIDLTRAVRHFEYGHGTYATEDGNFVHSPLGYEEIARYELPASQKIVRIQAEYCLSSMGRDGFAVLFGYEPSEVLFWQGRRKSNVIEVRLND